MYKEVPPDTWMLAFGWFMHAIFELRYGFPFHRNLRPIFLSFHCNKRDLLTPEALDYLRTCGPIGCRDWTTVDILLSVGVPAFFSGCMTTTVSNVFPDLAARPGPGAPVAYVDAPPESIPPGAVIYQHSSDAVRFRSFATNVYNGMELLETYRRKHSAMVTSRLHAWLPGRSIGIAVDFQPKNRSDIRFAGLIDTTDARVRRHPRRHQHQARAGHVRDPVRREAGRASTRCGATLTADDVAAAGVAMTAPARSPPSPGMPSTARGGRRRHHPGDRRRPASVVHQLAVHLPADRRRPCGADRVGDRQASRGVHVWVLTREPETVDAVTSLGSSPHVTISVVPTRGLGTDLLARALGGSRPRPRLCSC
jgi:hypothetical protein